MVLMPALTSVLSAVFWLGATHAGEFEVVERTVRFDPHNRFTRSAKIELGSLPLGSSIEVVLDVENIGDRTFAFSSVDPSCGCAKVEVDADELPPGEPTRFAVRLTTPRETRSAAFETVLTLKGTRGPRDLISLRLLYEPRGLATFPQALFVWDSARLEHQDLSVPIILTDPLHIRDITVEVRGELAEFATARLELQDDAEASAIVSIDVARALANRSAADGKLLLRKKTNGDELGSTLVLFRERKRLSVAPSILRFLKADDGDLKATAIVIDREGNSGSETSSAELSASIRFSLADEVLIAERQRLSANVCKYKVVLTEAQIAHLNGRGEKREIEWIASVDGERESGACAFLIEQ
jgi:hypothetical protein